MRQAPARTAELVALLDATDPVVAMRATDVLEKFSRSYPASLQPFKRVLLTQLARATQQEVCWHLAQMVPRLTLSLPERRRASKVLETYLSAKSSIVRTTALHGLADLAGTTPSLARRARRHLEAALLDGTPAMKARARQLLRRPQTQTARHNNRMKRTGRG